MVQPLLHFPDDRDGARAQVRGVRRQAGVVRALLDELERLQPEATVNQAVAQQMIDELTILGCRALEVAAALAAGELVPDAPTSGEHVRSGIQLTR